MSFFTAFLFLSPVPICAILARYLGAHRDSLSGTVMGSVRFQIAGTFAVYLFVLALTYLAVAPEKLGLNAEHAQELWEFELNAPYKTTRPASIRGTLFLKDGSQNVINVSGVVGRGQTTMTLRPGGIGLKSSQYLFLLVRPPDMARDLMAFGSFGSDISRVQLKVATLETELETAAQEKPGSMIISRVWPWRLWIVITLLPLVVVVTLSWVGPLIVRIAGEVGFLPKWIHYWFGNVAVKISGASAAYVIVVLTVLFTEVGVPRSRAAIDRVATETCGYIKNQWHFNLLHPYPGARGIIPDYTGTFTVDCAANDKPMQLVGGFANVMYQPQYRYTDESSCYKRVSPGKGNFTWRSVAVGVEDNRIIAIYQSDDETELGLLLGPARPDAQLKWIFADFKDYSRIGSGVNRGEMIIFREELLRENSCSSLSSSRLEARIR